MNYIGATPEGCHDGSLNYCRKEPTPEGWHYFQPDAETILWKNDVEIDIGRVNAAGLDYSISNGWMDENGAPTELPVYSISA